MRVLVDHPNPFFLAHGGMQIQIEQTCAALRAVGVDVDYVRWWDGAQTGDIIHYFGRPGVTYLAAAKQKGIRVAMAQILTGLGSRANWAIGVERTVIRAGKAVLPWMISARFAWDAFKQVDACIANTEWERHLMQYVFDAPSERLHVVPNGVEEVFLNSRQTERGKWLVCSATIAERKRIVELAEAAVHAGTPLWVIGRPYTESAPYYLRFKELVRQNSNVLRFEGSLEDRKLLAQAYREARGFVLLSVKETRSLSSEEAAACECPLLLSKLPWAESVFGDRASYAPVASPSVTAPYLRRFYDTAPQLPVPTKPLSWLQVAEQLKGIYQSLVVQPKPVARVQAVA